MEELVSRIATALGLNAALFLAVWRLILRSDRNLRAAPKRSIADWLLGKKALYSVWHEIFVSKFDALFGVESRKTKVFGRQITVYWPSFWRTLAIAVVFYCVVVIIYLSSLPGLDGVRFRISDNYRYIPLYFELKIRGQGVIDISVEKGLVAPFLFALTADYLSIVAGRYILGFFERARSIAWLLAVIACQAIVLAAILYFVNVVIATALWHLLNFYIVSEEFIGNDRSVYRWLPPFFDLLAVFHESLADDVRFLITSRMTWGVAAAVGLLPIFSSSLSLSWLLLFGFGLLIARIAQLIPAVAGFLKRYFKLDLKTRPLNFIGNTLIVFVTFAIWIWFLFSILFLKSADRMLV